jgi:hypothetical protein
LSVKPIIHLRMTIGESQSEELQKRLAALPFKIDYQEEQRGSLLLAVIGCTPSQEKIVRDLLHEIGVSMVQAADEGRD